MPAINQYEPGKYAVQDASGNWIDFGANQAGAEQAYNNLMGLSNATGNQQRGSIAENAIGGSGYYDPLVAMMQQQYLRDRLAQIELPTLDLQRQGQLFNQGMQQSQMSGYQAPLNREGALDYIWAQRPDLQNLARAQGIDYSSPDKRHQFIEGWMRAVTQMGAKDEPVVTRWGGDPLEVAKAMGAAKADPTMAREQLQSSQDLAMAQILGYVPSRGQVPTASEPMASIQPVSGDFAADPWRLAQTGGNADSTSQVPDSGNLTLAMRQFLLGQQGQQFGQGLALRQQSESERAAQAAEEARMAGLTGVIGGQQTLAGQSLAEQVAARRVADERASAQLSGVLGGQETLAARQAREALEEQRLARLGEQGFRQAQLEETRAGRLGQQSFQEAGITGLYGGQQTLAALRQQAELGLGGRAQTLAEQEAARRGGLEAAAQRLAEQRYGLEERGQEQQYGLAGRAQTLAEQRAAAEREATMANLSGVLGGQETLEARRARLADEMAKAQLGETREARLAREALEAGALTGSYGGQQTIAGRSLAEQVRAQQAREALEAGQLTGQYGGRDTLEKQRLAKQDQQFYSQLRANLSGPRDWLKYQQLQPQGAFGEMKASPSWEGMSGDSFWRTMQGAPGSTQGEAGTGIPRTVRQPHQISQTDYARMTPTKQAMQEGTWSAQGIDPQDAWKRMQASWNTGTAAKMRQWR